MLARELLEALFRRLHNQKAHTLVFDFTPQEKTKFAYSLTSFGALRHGRHQNCHAKSIIAIRLATNEEYP